VENVAGMKILQAIDMFSPSAGGSADVASRLAQALGRRGHEVTIITSDYRLETGYPESLPGIKVRAARNYFSLGGKPLLAPGIMTASKKELAGFDVVHLHNYPTVANAMIHRYARRYGVPYVLQPHGSLATYFQKGALKKLYDRLWGKAILKDAARVIAVAPAEAETCRNMGVAGEKIAVIPNGVDAAGYESLPPRGAFREKYGLGERRIILYLGRIHATKGLDLLARAFAVHVKESDNTLLVIAGPDDGYLPALRRLVKALRAEDKTIFTGPLYGQGKIQAMVDADVFVMPSAYEIFGIAVLEACICGTPVIVTDRCGIAPEITAETGQVIAYEESALRDALRKVLAAPPRDESSKIKRRQALLERFSWQKLAADFENIYRNILQTTGRGGD
jgi:glycosyltransferase involved in cell wall biosynthesis